MRLALLAPQPNPGSWSTVPHVPWSPSQNYGESRWMWWTKGMVEGGGMQHGHEPRPRPGEGGCHPAPPCPCREAAPGFLGAERVSAPALRRGTVWGTLHWSWVDLGFGLQEETRTNPGSRATATTGRILENRSTLLSPQMLDVCGGVGFGYFRKIFFFPWGEENISVAT